MCEPPGTALEEIATSVTRPALAVASQATIAFAVKAPDLGRQVCRSDVRFRVPSYFGKTR